MTDAREQQLFEELAEVTWDIVLLSATWRETEEEIWTSCGNMFLAAGGTVRNYGVAVILHKRWVKGFKGFKRVSERLCSVDLNVVGGRFSIVVPYMPTA